MREQELTRQQRLAYEKTLYRYSSALERGNLDTIITILHEAEDDPHLEQLIIELHQAANQQEELTMSQEQPQSTTYTTPSPEVLQHPGVFSKRAQRPRKRWLVALQGIAAVLVVIVVIGSALFLFSSTNKKTQVGHRTVQATSPDIIVLAQDRGVKNKAGVPSGDQGIVTAYNIHTGVVLWQTIFTQNMDPNDRINVAIQDHVVYVASNKLVQALRASDGQILWQTSLGPRDQHVIIGDNMPQLIVEQGRVYASGYSYGDLNTLDAKTGKLLWHYSSGIPALLAVSHGRAYVLANDTHIKALDGNDGHMLWNYDVQTQPISATTDEHTLYVQTGISLKQDPYGMHKDQKPLLAIDSTTGKKVWSVIAPANAPSQLVVAQGIIALYDGGSVCGYRISDGKQAWCGPHNNSMINSSGLASADGTIYAIYATSFGSQSIIAINSRDGSMEWSTSQKHVAPFPLILVLGDQVIVPQFQVVLNRADGKLKPSWKFSKDYILSGAVGK